MLGLATAHLPLRGPGSTRGHGHRSQGLRCRRVFPGTQRRARGRTAPRRGAGRACFQAQMDGHRSRRGGGGAELQSHLATAGGCCAEEQAPPAECGTGQVPDQAGAGEPGPESRGQRRPRAPPKPLPRVHASRSAPCRAAGQRPRTPLRVPRSRSGSGCGARPRPARVPETPPGPGPLDASGSTVQSLLPRDLPPSFLNVRLGLMRGCRYVAFQKEYFHLQ